MPKSKNVRSVLAVVILGLVAVFAAAMPASAAPRVSGPHPYPYEAAYPTIAPCKGTFQQVRSVSKKLPNGHTVTVSLYYSDKCGAYARQDSQAKDGCAVGAIRDSKDNRYGTLLISESNDGLNYAYTEMVNDLQHRLARAEVACPVYRNSELRFSTGWY